MLVTGFFVEQTDQPPLFIIKFQDEFRRIQGQPQRYGAGERQHYDHCPFKETGETGAADGGIST